MKQKNITIWAVSIFLLLISLACLVSFAGDKPTEDEISVALTLQAIQQTQTAAAAPIATDEQPAVESPAVPTNTPEADEEEDPEDTCNVSKFVSETIPDGSVYQKGDLFTKTWNHPQ